MQKVPVYLVTVLLGGIGLILLGVVFSTHGVDIGPLDKKDLASFFKEMGFACVIVFMIAVIIERAAKQEQVELFDKFVKDPEVTS